MRQSNRFGRSRFTLILLVLASLTVVTLSYRDSGPVKAVGNVFGTVFSPLQGVGDAIASPFRNGWKGITDYDDLEKENERLQKEIDELRSGPVRDAALEEENAQLRRLRGIDDFAEELPQVTARVRQGPLSAFESTFRIDKGSGDGITVGMPVVTGAGLVGRVVEVEGGEATIRVITDPDYGSFGVRVLPAGDVGKATPGGPGGMIRVEEGIHNETPVATGDPVVTSGLDGSAYPANIPVGTVLRVGQTEDLTEKSLEIEPLADLDGLSYVVVLLCDGDCR